MKTLACGIGIFASFILGIMWGQQSPGTSSVASAGEAQDKKPTESIRGRSLELVDDEGRVRIRLTGGAKEGPQLSFLDEAGSPKMSLALLNGKEPGVLLSAADSSSSIRLRMDKGVPHLELYDQDGRPRVKLYANGAESSGMTVSDVQRKVRAQVGIGKNDSPAFIAFDPDNRAYALLGVGRDGTPGLAISDRDRKVRASMSVKDGAPALKLYDAERKPIWEAPK